MSLFTEFLPSGNLILSRIVEPLGEFCADIFNIFAFHRVLVRVPERGHYLRAPILPFLENKSPDFQTAALPGLRDQPLHDRPRSDVDKATEDVRTYEGHIHL